MRHKVPKSTSDSFGDFLGKVVAHGAELKQWAEHMDRVARDAKNPNLVEAARHEPYPRPTAPADIEHSVGEDFQPNFEIIDDGLTADQKLAIKKNTLFSVVTAMENAALEAIVPSSKRRFFAIRESEVLASDRDAQLRLMDEGKPMTRKQLDDVALKARSDEDARFMDEQAERRIKMDDIIRRAAKMHHDIEDLTAENVDAYKPESLS